MEHDAGDARMIKLVNGDCVEAMRDLPDASIDAVVTDPPYELGFMGKGWDASGIAYSVEMWRQVLRVLKPGGHLLAFGGTRTYHRMACAIEDAGFEIRDSIHWVYGSGFPKSHNLVGAWDGWGTALKPAHEPIVVARKPFIGTVAANVQAHGTGALNIDGCRVGTEMRVNPPAGNKPGTTALNMGVYGMPDDAAPTVAIGRWPPNILLSHTPECIRVGTKRVKTATNNGSVSRPGVNVYGDYAGNRPAFDYADADGMETVESWECAEDCPVAEMDRQGGGASRFFPVFRYQAKASRSERDYGLDSLLSQTVRSGMGGTMPTDDQGKQRDRFTVEAKNIHPTVKPVALMEWLVKLVTPPGGTVLDPFLGSGTTGVAAARLGFSFVGIEREPQYFEICKARIDHASESVVQRNLFVNEVQDGRG